MTEMTREELERYIRGEVRRKTRVHGASMYNDILKIVGKEIADAVESGEIVIIDKNLSQNQGVASSSGSKRRIRDFFAEMLKRQK